MKKKLTLLIVALSLIVSFGFTNVYAAWVEGDSDDWYFQLEATDSTATAWDLTFHAVDDTFLANFFLETQATPTDVGFVSGTYDVDFYMKGYGPMGAIVDRGNGNIGNIGGGILGGGYDFIPGESMTVAHLTFADTVDLDFLWIENMYFGFEINEKVWDQSNLLATNDGITAPAADLFEMGLNPNPNTFGQTVPIPGAIWLLGSAMLGLFGINKRKKK